jgi:hypothetical protein
VLLDLTVGRATDHVPDDDFPRGVSRGQPEGVGRAQAVVVVLPGPFHLPRYKPALRTRPRCNESKKTEEMEETERKQGSVLLSPCETSSFQIKNNISENTSVVFITSSCFQTFFNLYCCFTYSCQPVSILLDFG